MLSKGCAASFFTPWRMPVEKEAKETERQVSTDEVCQLGLRTCHHALTLATLHKQLVRFHNRGLSGSHGCVPVAWRCPAERGCYCACLLLLHRCAPHSPISSGIARWGGSTAHTAHMRKRKLGVQAHTLKGRTAVRIPALPSIHSPCLLPHFQFRIVDWPTEVVKLRHTVGCSDELRLAQNEPLSGKWCLSQGLSARPVSLRPLTPISSRKFSIVYVSFHFSHQFLLIH